MRQNDYYNFKWTLEDFVAKGVRKGGFVLTPRFSLICYKNFITFSMEINYFRILFAC